MQETECWCANVSTDTVYTLSFIMQSLQTHANKISCLPILSELMLFPFFDLSSQTKSVSSHFFREKEPGDKFKCF